EPVAQAGGSFLGIALAPEFFEKRIANLGLARWRINAKSGAADHDAVRFAADAQLAQLTGFKEFDPMRYRFLALGAGKGHALAGQVPRGALGAMQAHQVLDLIHSPAGQHQPVRFEEVQTAHRPDATSRLRSTLGMLKAMCSSAVVLVSTLTS